jgi:hypothetical protein
MSPAFSAFVAFLRLLSRSLGGALDTIVHSGGVQVIAAWQAGVAPDQPIGMILCDLGSMKTPKGQRHDAAASPKMLITHTF